MAVTFMHLCQLVIKEGSKLIEIYQIYQIYQIVTL